MPGDRQSDEEKLAIARRQRRVWHLHVVRKLTLDEISQAMAVSVATVARDLAAVRKRTRGLLRRKEKLEESVLDAGSEVLEEISAVIRQAWTDCLAAPEGTNTRARYLKVLLEAVAERVKIMQSLGLLDKVPEEVLLGDMFGFDIRGLSDAEIRRALAFFRSLRAESGGGAGGDPAAAGGPQALDRGEPVDSNQDPGDQTVALQRSAD